MIEQTDITRKIGVSAWLLVYCMTFSVFSTHVVLQFTPALMSRVEAEHGTAGRQRVEQWQRLLVRAMDMPENQKLNAVNQFVNARQFLSDQRLWNQQDYWATPVEFLGLGAGDCEDFSIAKYISLRALGVPAEKLRLMYANARSINQAHMVLAYYSETGGEPMILDNLVENILPASEREDLQPIYSFNGEGLWLAKAKGRGRQVQGPGNNQMWEDLSRRIEVQNRNIN